MVGRTSRRNTDTPEIISSSRLEYSWRKAKPWLFGPEFVYAVAFTGALAVVHFYGHRPHKFGASLDYLWEFLGSAGVVLVLRFLWALAVHPWKLHMQTFQQHLGDHAQAESLESRLGVVETTLAALGESLTELRTNVAGMNPMQVTLQAGATLHQHLGGGSNAEPITKNEDHEVPDPGVDT
jgi:hypothetical protein